jgi:uncharacterized iron-regulated membrane protein
MLTPKTLKAWYLIHKWTSLICMVFLLLLCLTGLPLIFHHEIDHLLGDAVEPPAMPADTPTANLDDIVATAKERRPNDFIQFVSQPADEPDAWFVTMAETPTAEEASAAFMFDARTGALLKDFKLHEGFMHLMFTLHVDLFAGLPGTLFLGFMGFLFVVSLVSGVVVYGPFMRKLPFGAVRRERSSRLKWLDLHNLLGIVTLVWAFVVGLTGVINTLARPIFGYWQFTELAAMTAPYRSTPPLATFGSLQQATDTARAAEPHMAIVFVAFPGTNFAGQHHYAVFMRGTTPLTTRLFKPVLIDAQTVELTATRELPWYVKALLVSQPLHFGDYGGMPLKIIWALLDILTIVVLGSGLYLWLKRRNVVVEEWLGALQSEETDRLPVTSAVSQREVV